MRPDGLRRTSASASAWEEDSADVSECESESESAASELKPAAARSGGPRDSPCASRARWMSARISASFAYVTETRAAKAREDASEAQYYKAVGQHLAASRDAIGELEGIEARGSRVQEMLEQAERALREADAVAAMDDDDNDA